MELHRAVVLEVVVHPVWAVPFTTILLDLVASKTAPLAPIQLKADEVAMEHSIKVLE